MNKQRGAISILNLFTIVAFGFLVMLVVRFGPLYMEFMTVKSTLDSLQGEYGLAKKNPRAIMVLLGKRLRINRVESFKADQLVVKQQPKAKELVVSYKVQRHVLANVDAVFNFEHSITIHE